MRKFLLLMLLFKITILQSQDNRIDSIKKILYSTDIDTLKVKEMIQLSKEYRYSNLDSAIQYNDKSIEYSKKVGYDIGLADGYYNKAVLYYIVGDLDSAQILLRTSEKMCKAFNYKKGEMYVYYLMGTIHSMSGDYFKAIKYYQKAIKISIDINDLQTKASLYNAIGTNYLEQSIYPNAIENFYKSLEISLHINTSDNYKRDETIASSYSNIGEVLRMQKKYKEAQIAYLKAIPLFKKYDNKRGLGMCYNNLGLIFSNNYKQQDSALYFHTIALQLREESDDAYNIAASLNNIGSVYYYKNKLEEASVYYNKALNIRTEIKDEPGIATTLNNLGNVNSKMGNGKKAIEYQMKSLEIAKRIGYRESELGALIGLTEAYREIGDYKNALTYQSKYIALTDTLFNESKSKEIGKVEAKYEFAREQEEESRKEQEQLKLAKEERNRRDNLQFSFIFIAILVVFGITIALLNVKISPRFAEGLIFFAFLIFFEFCLVLLDPYVDVYSGGEPIYKLIFNALLALLIFPAHAYMENKLKSRIKKIPNIIDQ